MNHIASKWQFQEFKERHNIDISENSGIGKNTTKEDLQNITVSEKINFSFPGGFTPWKTMSHEHFWPVNTTIWKTTYNGQSIEVIFAHASNNPSLVWIENIRLSDCPIDSHGIPEVIFNGGLLTAKPAEYLKQVPSWIEDQWQHFSVAWREYVDIRPFLQDNPLIVQFKNLTGMKKAA
jgi:hypothetical protein